MGPGIHLYRPCEHPVSRLMSSGGGWDICWAEEKAWTESLAFIIWSMSSIWVYVALISANLSDAKKLVSRVKREQYGCWNENIGTQLDDQKLHESLWALCLNSVQRGSVKWCHSSEIQQGSYESIHQTPRVEVKTVQRLLGCMSPVGTRMVQNQILCDPHRDSWCRRRESPQTGEMADCPLSFLILPLFWVWL